MRKMIFFIICLFSSSTKNLKGVQKYILLQSSSFIPLSHLFWLARMRLLPVIHLSVIYLYPEFTLLEEIQRPYKFNKMSNICPY